MGDASGALRRIDAALDRIEAAAGARPASTPAGNSGETDRLRAALETALVQLDNLIAELERNQ